MSVPPKYAGIKLSESSAQNTPHTLEIYLDYVCPFSAKMFKTLTSIPSLKTTYKSSLNVILRQQVQPWHPTSTLTHEAALAVLKVSPEKYWSFSAALFDAQTEYFDISVVNETRNQTYARLAKLAGSVGVDEKAVLDLLTIPDKPGQDGALNSGNGVTVDLKWVIKTARLIGVHVSPTVFFNGVEERGISSGFSVEQWEEWLAKNVV